MAYLKDGTKRCYAIYFGKLSSRNVRFVMLGNNLKNPFVLEVKGIKFSAE